MKKISVVIPAYNEEDVIIDCLSSLDKQTHSNFEVIIVDDGSTDKTPKLVKGFNPNKYKLVIIKQNHKGPGAGRNLGSERATSEILVFVDADMTFDKDFLEKLVKPIDSGEEKGTFSKEEHVSNWGNIWAKCWNINEGWADKRRHPANYPDKQKVFRAILKSEFDKVDGFDPGGYTDDYSLSEKLGYEAVVAKGARFYHKNPSSLFEIFKHAKWVGKRPYKLGVLGCMVALIRASLPVSLIVGLFKSIIKLQPAFLIFKVVYDFGIFLGILEYIFLKKQSK
ncbi:glycosyltransferase [Patescibacteria group bacterium]|nr:glycosyltransferase [Patescibacteria group bacterium]MBU0845654.1 glycosyltransferase [Patescibacteria group bacterium]MBU0923220.1 glycosyltransferase [Patescibacteria group bacterium]